PLDVFRNGKTIQVKIKPAECTDPNMTVAASRRIPVAPDDPAAMGLTVHSLTRELANQFGVEMREGVLVISVEKETVAARKGIKAGDVITSINQQAITNPKQFREVLKKADAKKGI